MGPLTLILLVAASYVLPGAAAFPVRDVELPPPDRIGPDVRISDPAAPTGPPDNPQVGDSWVWWLWTWQPMPPHFEQHVCTIRGRTDRGYVAVKDSEWLVSIDQADVDAILEHWENSSIGPYPEQGIYEIDSLSFGTPPDELDDDPRIYLMWYDFEIAADGFFFYFDQYPEGTYPGYHSNECEVIYLNTTSTGGPSGDYMHGVMAHEFEHLIHWKYDGNESQWVDEGMAELAMYFFGHPDNVSAFNTSPDNDLTQWDGAWADYIQTYLWTLYFFERYGGHETIYAVVHEPANSMAGYDAVLDQFGYTENTGDVFADWTVANFLDDTSIADGRFGYLGEELPPFSTAGSYSSYPAAATKTVNSWAADYYRFQDIPFEALELGFDGSDDNTFALRALVMNPTEPTGVVEFPLEASTQSGSLWIGGLSPESQVILAVASASSTGGNQYQFTAGEALGLSPDDDPATPLSIASLESPARGTASFAVSWPGGEPPSVKIFDLQGRVVETLKLNPGGIAIWNAPGRASGVYFARAVHETGVASARIVFLP